MEVVVREEIAARYAGDVEAMAEALDDLEDVLDGGGDAIGLNDPRRDEAFAGQGG